MHGCSPFSAMPSERRPDAEEYECRPQHSYSHLYFFLAAVLLAVVLADAALVLAAGLADAGAAFFVVAAALVFVAINILHVGSSHFRSAV